MTAETSLKIVGVSKKEIVVHPANSLESVWAKTQGSKSPSFELNLGRATRLELRFCKVCSGCSRDSENR